MKNNIFIQFVIFMSAEFAPMPVSFADVVVDRPYVEHLIKSKHIQTIEDLLANLPESFRSKYVVMFHSRSLHGSSFLNPRILLYAPEARYILSFSGDPSLPGYQAVEATSFNEDTHSFEYQEILFPDSSNPPNQNVTFSELNPPKCQKCHGQPTRPIWDSHPEWPGALGELYNKPLSTEESNGLKDFLTNQPKHPRYKHLAHIELLNAYDRLNPDARAHQTYDGGDDIAPNEEFSMLIYHLNNDRIAYDVSKVSGFKDFRYAILASLDPDCGPIDDFIPAQTIAHARWDLKTYRQITLAANLAQEGSKFLRLQSQHRSQGQGQKNIEHRDLSDSESLVTFRFIFESLLNHDTNEWTTALERGTFNFTPPTGSTLDFEHEIQSAIQTIDARIVDLLPLRPFPDRYCASLKTKSLAALASWQPLAVEDKPVPPKLEDAPILLARCANCHEQGVGPHIPFGSHDQLAVALSSGLYTHGKLIDEIKFRLSKDAGGRRMPLGLNVSDEARANLLDYFVKLAGRPAVKPQ